MTADVIEGPWAKNSSKSTADELEAAKILAGCDQVVSDCTIAVLQNLVDLQGKSRFFVGVGQLTHTFLAHARQQN